jgi:hypothetical protein
VSLLYSGKNQSGDALIAGSAVVGPRYDRWTSHDFYTNGASQNVRSLSVFPATTGASACILFSEYQGWGSDFGGDFIQVTNAHSSAQWDENIPEWFYWYPGGTPQPKPRSMLVLQTQRRPEVRFSFRDTVVPLWNAFTADNLPEQVVLKGDPRLCWMAFPRMVEHLNENSIYLFIGQEIEIDFTDFWSNYAARFAFWLHLHVNDGAVTGHVAKWNYWIEGGAFTSVVEAILEPNLKLAVIALDQAINTALSGLPTTVTSLYYLPGRQLTPVQSGYFDFHVEATNNDVTIVAEL